MPLTVFPPREYGEMYQYNQNHTVEIDVKDAAYDIDNFTGGLTQGVTFQNGKELLIEVAGIYNVQYGICYTDGVATEYRIVLTINDIVQNKSLSCAKKSNAGDMMGGARPALFDLSEGDIVKLAVINITNTNDAIIHNANIVITRYN